MPTNGTLFIADGSGRSAYSPSRSLAGEIGRPAPRPPNPTTATHCPPAQKKPSATTIRSGPSRSGNGCRAVSTRWWRHSPGRQVMLCPWRRTQDRRSPSQGMPAQPAGHVCGNNYRADIRDELTQPMTDITVEESCAEFERPYPSRQAPTALAKVQNYRSRGEVVQRPEWRAATESSLIGMGTFGASTSLLASPMHPQFDLHVGIDLDL